MMSDNLNNSDRFFNLLTDNSLKDMLNKMPGNLARQTTLVWVKLAMQMADKPDKLKTLFLTCRNGVLTGKDMSYYIMQIWEDLQIDRPNDKMSESHVPTPRTCVKSEVGSLDDWLSPDEQTPCPPSRPLASRPTAGSSKNLNRGDMFVAAFTDSNKNNEKSTVKDSELDKVSSTTNENFHPFELRAIKVKKLRPRRISISCTSSSDDEETQDAKVDTKSSLTPVVASKKARRKRSNSHSSSASEPEIQKFHLRSRTRFMKRAKAANAKVQRISHKKLAKIATPIKPRTPNLADKNLPAASKVNMFFCRQCSSGFKYKKNLDRHVNEVHSQPTIFKCSDCEAVFTRKRSLVGHYQALHAEVRTSYPCENCGIIFYVRPTYRKHIKTCN